MQGCQRFGAKVALRPRNWSLDKEIDSIVGQQSVAEVTGSWGGLERGPFNEISMFYNSCLTVQEQGWGYGDVLKQSRTVKVTGTEALHSQTSLHSAASTRLASNLIPCPQRQNHTHWICALISQSETSEDNLPVETTVVPQTATRGWLQSRVNPIKEPMLKCSLV